MKKKYLRIGQAAKFLGVSTSTLRHWDKTGKIKTHRFPYSNHRLFNIEDLEKLLEETYFSHSLSSTNTKED